jgi:hypothetical protein
VLEIVLGALLLFGFWSKKVTWGLLGTIIFFTFLTFVSAYFKIVTSCGCFGDAIPLTPWQSFSKDLVLLVLIVYLFLYHRLIKPITDKPGLQKGLLAECWYCRLYLVSILIAGCLFWTFYPIKWVQIFPN